MPNLLKSPNKPSNVTVYKDSDDKLYFRLDGLVQGGIGNDLHAPGTAGEVLTGMGFKAEDMNVRGFTGKADILVTQAYADKLLYLMEEGTVNLDMQTKSQIKDVSPGMHDKYFPDADYSALKEIASQPKSVSRYTKPVDTGMSTGKKVGYSLASLLAIVAAFEGYDQIALDGKYTNQIFGGEEQTAPLVPGADSSATSIDSTTIENKLE